MLVEDQQEDMLSDLAQLVSVNTSFPPGDNYSEIVELLAHMTADLGGDSRQVNVPEELWRTDGVHGPRINLLRMPALGHSDLPVLSIYFHIDTAPAGEGWSRQPFKFNVEGDRLYGRGTADMKGAIAAVLGALRIIKTHSIELAFRPVLLFCTDEEGGLYPGIRFLAEQHS